MDGQDINQWVQAACPSEIRAYFNQVNYVDIMTCLDQLDDKISPSSVHKIIGALEPSAMDNVQILKRAIDLMSQEIQRMTESMPEDDSDIWYDQIMRLNNKRMVYQKAFNMWLLTALGEESEVNV
jgi:hypothetical protein